MKKQVQKGWEDYRALWSKLTGWRLFLFYLIHYTLLFLVVSHFVFSDFAEAKRTFIGTSDGVGYFADLVNFNQTIRDGIQAFIGGEGWTFPLYDFRIGPIKATWGVEPIQLLAIFCPQDQLDKFYDILVLVRYYLIGVSFSVFGFYFNQTPLPILIGSISYTFCGFSILAGVRHPQFMAPMIFLPLLIIGTEKVLKKERPFVLMASVFLAMSNLYFACMLAIMVLLYALVRFFALYEKDRGREFASVLGRLALSGGTGIVLSSIVWVPSLLKAFGSGRIGRDVAAYSDLLKYSFSYYQKFLSDFIVTPDSIGAWTCLGFSVLAIPAVILLFLRRERKQQTLRILFLILTTMLLLPVVAYVMSGFNTLSNRWCFGYAFCVSAIIMFQVPHFSSVDKQTLAFVLIGVVGYVAICYLADSAYLSRGAVVLLIISLLLLCICWFLERWGRKTMLPTCLLVITCFSVCYSAFLKYDADQGNYISQFAKENAPYQYFETSQYSSFSQSEIAGSDTSFYRVTGDAMNSRKVVSTSFYYDINGLTACSSYAYSGFLQWMEELELAREDTMLRFCGLRSRAYMLALASVKYHVARTTVKGIIPYGFQEIERVKNNGKTDIILENQFALPIGYTYDSYLPYEKYKQLSVLDKQNAQMQAVVLTETPGSSGIAEAAITSEAKQVPVTITESKGLSWKNEKLKVTEENATLTLAFEGLPETETYLRIVNLDLTKGTSTRHWSLTAATESTKASAEFAADAYVYSNGMKTKLLDLGYTEDGYTTCTVTFPSKGTFKLEDLQIWCQPMDNFDTQIDVLREESLENVETNWWGLTGTISVSRDKMLCIAIPYDKGWTAYVDGQKVKLYQANTAFMAIELPAGDHEIELKYWMPGLTAGIVLSAFGAIGLGAVIIYWKRKKS